MPPRFSHQRYKPEGLGKPMQYGMNDAKLWLAKLKSGIMATDFRLPFHFFLGKALDDVAFLDIVIGLQTDTALVTGGYFLGVILKAFQG